MSQKQFTSQLMKCFIPTWLNVMLLHLNDTMLPLIEVRNTVTQNYTPHRSPYNTVVLKEIKSLPEYVENYAQYMFCKPNFSPIGSC